MTEQKLTVARKALFWWFRWPANPSVCVNFAVDATAALAYLARLAEQHGHAVTVNHLVTGTVSRVLQEFPRANDRLVRGRLLRRRRTSLAMPVDLRAGGRPGEQETAMAVLEDTQDLSLVEIAAGTRDVVGAERAHRSKLGWVRWLTRAADRTPYPVLAPMLTGLDRLARLPVLTELLYGDLPGSGVSNVGAAVGLREGMVFRGGSLAIPQRLMHVGTVWGLSAIQDEVIPIDGTPQVRPMLPVVLCFDHRLFDGVFAGKLAVRFSEILLHPEADFGADGTRRSRG